ncbi:hypothetical protein GMI69_06475 [Eggerthellaceae bacterium zg-887]|nr:hypothetical protein [Xiamenia xianingshaonis]
MIRMEKTETTQPESYIDAQIRKLKSAGVTFEKCTEREARDYLAVKCSACKVSAYARLFDIHAEGENEGKYMDLDFSQLKYLADIDQRLREILLAMSLDIEHFCKTRLTIECAVTEADDRQVMAVYLNDQDDRQRKYIAHEIERSKNDPTNDHIFEKYGDQLPLSAFMEVVPFGTIVGLIRYCGTRSDDKELIADYFVLRSVQALRNACAHNSCILLDLFPHTDGKKIAPPEMNKALSAIGMSKRIRHRWLQTVPTARIASLLYLYSEMVPEGNTRTRRLDALNEFLVDVEKDSVLPMENPAIAALTFAKRLMTGFHLLN